jgi:2-keto-4-pentenoate hydratase/2-oxohepta-3-ene-1,7-dioic acid hydratase in catechol pathway
VKLCRYNDDQLAVVRDGQLFDITQVQTDIRNSSAYAMMGDPVIAALPHWRQRMEEAANRARGVPLASVSLLCPVVRPSKVMAAPTNYKKHIEEMQKRREGQPSKMGPNIGTAGIFLKANSSLVGPSEGIALRFPERRNEHEVELVAVIGQRGTDISQANALDHIAGYCLGLDMTARGPEDRSFRKSIDSYSVVGPWFVTADEVPNPNAVPLHLFVNDQQKQNANTSDMVYSMERLIEFASSFYTLHPGDLYFTGTPEGVSPVVSGDVVRVTSLPALGELVITARAHKRGDVA